VLAPKRLRTKKLKGLLAEAAPSQALVVQPQG